jgi:hypothetical protein
MFYCLRFETPPTWRARSPYLNPPGIGWPSYAPGNWFPLLVVSYHSKGYRGGIRPRLYAVDSAPIMHYIIAWRRKVCRNVAVWRLKWLEGIGSVCSMSGVTEIGRDAV